MQQALEIIIGGLAARRCVRAGRARLRADLPRHRDDQSRARRVRRRRRAVALHVPPGAAVAAAAGVSRIACGDHGRSARCSRSSSSSRRCESCRTAGMVILTAGLLTLFEGAILLCWGSQPYQLEPFSGSRPYEVFGLRFPTQSPWDAGATMLIVFALWYVLQKTTVGKALRACSENPAAAALMGIDVQRMTIISYAVAGGHRRRSPAWSSGRSSRCSSTAAASSRTPVSSRSRSAASRRSSARSSAVWASGLIEQGAAGYISSLFSTTIALVLLAGDADLAADRHHRRAHPPPRRRARRAAQPKSAFRPSSTRCRGACWAASCWCCSRSRRSCSTRSAAADCSARSSSRASSSSRCSASTC